METTISIPQELIDELQVRDPQQLRQALILGLEQLRAGQSLAAKSRVISTLLATGRVHPLDPTLVSPYESDSSSSRQEPPTLDGPPVSEVIIEQRRG